MADDAKPLNFDRDDAAKNEAASSETEPKTRRLTLDDLREELKPILSKSEAANLC